MTDRATLSLSWLPTSIIFAAAVRHTKHMPKHLNNPSPPVFLSVAALEVVYGDIRTWKRWGHCDPTSAAAGQILTLSKLI